MFEKLWKYFLSGGIFSEKKNVIKEYFILIFIFFIFTFIVSKFNWMAGFFAASILFFSLLGYYLFSYYSSELDEKYSIKNLGNINNLSYQGESLVIFSFITISISIFIITIFTDISMFKCFLISVIFMFPFLGIGLRFKTFHDDSKFIKEKNGKEKIDVGYIPTYYFFVSCIICYLGYYQLLFPLNRINFILILLLTFICHMLIIFPDKTNKFLPFNNRTKIGLIIYLGAIIIIFLLCLRLILPVENLLLY